MLVIVCPDSWWVMDSMSFPPTIFALAVAQPDLALRVRSPSAPETAHGILWVKNWYSDSVPIEPLLVTVSLVPSEFDYLTPTLSGFLIFQACFMDS